MRVVAQTFSLVFELQNYVQIVALENYYFQYKTNIKSCWLVLKNEKTF